MTSTGWITLSVVASILIAISHEVRSLYAAYGLQALYLQSFGNTITSSAILFILSSNICSLKSEENQSLIKLEKQSMKSFNFDWLRTIYCEKTSQTSDIENYRLQYRVIKMRVFWTVLLVAITLLSVACIIGSTKLAVSINLNLGVMS